MSNSCRQSDGRCAVCGGDWSVCGCQRMLDRSTAAAPTPPVDAVPGEPVPAIVLPPLPEVQYLGYDTDDGRIYGYTADTTEDFARAAVLADRVSVADRGVRAVPGKHDGSWSVFNSGGACVIENVTFPIAADYMTADRFASGWTMVSVIKSPAELAEVESIATTELADMKHQRDLLGQAIADAAKKAGVYNGEVALDGHRLLMMCEHLSELGNTERFGTQASRDVLAERNRQIEVEGWSKDHDDEHDGGELAGAAAAYAAHASDALHPLSQGDAFRDGTIPDGWCWEPAAWKPGAPRRNLVKAGALIFAEIERIDRSSAGEAQS